MKLLEKIHKARMQALAEEGPQVVVTIQGKLCECKVKEPYLGFVPQHSRGVVHGFSRAARLRLLKAINRIEWRKAMPGVFVTLTYPDAVGERTYQERTKDRHLFLRYVEKYLGYNVSGVWRTEWKARRSGPKKGMIMPHVHMMLFGVRFIPKEEIRQWWRNILHVEGHLATDVQAIKDGKKAGIYIAKYIGKKEEYCTLDIPAYLNNPGRNWGFARKGNIPLCTKEEFLLVDDMVKEWLFNYANSNFPWVNPNHRGSFTVFGERATYIGAMLAELGLTDDGEIR